MLHIYPKKMKTLIPKDKGTPYVYCSIIYKSQDIGAAQMPIDRWMNKEDVVYRMEYHSVIKKWWDLDICDNIGGPRGYYVC